MKLSKINFKTLMLASAFLALASLQGHCSDSPLKDNADKKSSVPLSQERTKNFAYDEEIDLKKLEYVSCSDERKEAFDTGHLSKAIEHRLNKHLGKSKLSTEEVRETLWSVGRIWDISDNGCAWFLGALLENDIVIDVIDSVEKRTLTNVKRAFVDEADSKIRRLINESDKFRFMSMKDHEFALEIVKKSKFPTVALALASLVDNKEYKFLDRPMTKDIKVLANILICRFMQK